MYKDHRNYENVNRMHFAGGGEYDTPTINPVEFTEAEFISFNYAKTTGKTKGKAVHFFIDDYQFNRVWTHPDDYINLLSKFDYVLSPDFSLYIDYPRAIQIYNHYRKHWCGAYWQMHGIKVIPTICWSDEKSYEWCFDGEPMHSTVAISSVGTQNNPKSKEMFLKGYREMVRRLEPTQIIFYGIVPEECKGNIVRVKSFSENLHKAEVAQW